MKRSFSQHRLVQSCLIVAGATALSSCGTTASEPKVREGPAILWERAFAGEAEWGVRTGDGGYAVLVTRSQESDKDNKDNKDKCLELVRLNASGDELWRKVYEDNSADARYSMCEAVAGGFAVVGSTGKWAANRVDIRVLRLDQEGAVLWSRTYGGKCFDWASSVVSLGDGSFVVGGTTVSMGAGKLDFYLLKIDETGEPLWERTYGAETWEGQYESGPQVRATRDGGFILVGSTDSESLQPDESDVAVYLVRTDSRGEKLWEGAYGVEGGFDVGITVLEMEDEGFLVAGNRSNRFQGLYLLRTDSHGDALWERTYSGSVHSRNVHLAPVTGSRAGGYVLATLTWLPRSQAYLVRVDSAGEKIWEKRLVVQGSYNPVGLWTVEDGSVVVLCKGAGDGGSALVSLLPEQEGE